jgi:hypothetical protein
MWYSYACTGRNFSTFSALFLPRKDHHSMSKQEIKTTLGADGLRYRSKAAGSPFAATGAFGAATMSCFLCGKHRPRAQLKTRKLLGRAQSVCAPSCKEADATPA